jgi:3-oxoacyl-[acyl-carrier-protein] synthase II
VVVTGIGAVTSLGHTAHETWDALAAGRSGLAAISRFDPTSFATTFAGSVTGFGDSEAPERWTNLALAASREAIAQAGIDVSRYADRTAVLIGTAASGIEQVEMAWRAKKPIWASPTAATDAIAAETGATGPVLTYGASFTGSANAIGEAMTMIRTGRIDFAIAGGAEAPITLAILAGFIAMGATSQQNDEPVHAVKPFAADRDGCSLGEGSAVLVLEVRERAIARGATILAEVVGYGATADAFHVVALPDDGDALVRAMRLAMAQAGIVSGEIGYINAHGTGTTMNDLVETTAMKTVLGDAASSVPISSTKPATGHLLGAAGSLEAVISLMALSRNQLPPTLNLRVPDPVCDLDYVPLVARDKDLEVVMSNSMGFGGHATSLIFRRG